MQKTITLLIAGMMLAPAIGFARSGTVTNSKLVQTAMRQDMTATPVNVKEARAAELRFIENKGQVTDQYDNIRHDIRYHVAAGRGLDVYVGQNALHYQFTKQLNDPLAGLEPGELPDEEVRTMYASYRMDVVLVGANPNPTVKTAEGDYYYERYFISDNPADASTVVRSYKKVIYENVYPNIDWVIYSNGKHMEYDFVVRPGGKVSDIRIQYNGAQDVKLNKDGSLTATTPMGAVTERAPYSFQQDNERTVASSFVLNNNTLGFRTGSYKGTLVIDPVVSWSTYLGGSGGDYLGTGASACSDIIAIDAECNLYASGRTDTRNIATSGAYQDTFSTGSNQFLAKFNPDGSIVYVTYYPVSLYYPQAATDYAGGVYLSGPAIGSAHPAATPVGAYQRNNAGDYDAFIAKFNSDGDREWATFYGGMRRDQPGSIRCDIDNNVYMGGVTQFPNQQVGGSTDLATPNAYKRDTIGKQDGWFVKFSPTGAVRWATYFGGTENESISSIDCDSKGNVYVAGSTTSRDIATIGNMTLQGTSDAFLAKFKGDGTHLWTRYVGGEGSDGGHKTVIHVDKEDNILLSTAVGSSTGIATSGTWRDVYSSATGTNAGLVKIDSTGTTLWGTYMHRGPMASIKTDPHNDIWVCAYPQFFPGMDTLVVTPDAHKDSTNLYNREGWIGKLSSDGTELKYGSFWGSVGEEYFISLAVDNSGGVYAAGYTVGGIDLATPGAYQDTFGGGTIDGIIVRFTDCSVFTGTDVAAEGPISFCQGESVKLNVETPAILGCVSYQWQLNGTNIAGSNTESYEARVSGDYSVIIRNATGECTDTSVNVISVVVHDLPEPIITRDGDVLTTDSAASYQWYRNNAPIDGATGRSHTATRDGNYKVTVIDENGCEGTSDGMDVLATSVSNIAAEGLRIYPNPVNHTVHVDAAVPVNITITSIEGKIVAQHNNAVSADVSGLADGVYLIRITDANNTLLLVEKMVKAK